MCRIANILKYGEANELLNVKKSKYQESCKWKRMLGMDLAIVRTGIPGIKQIQVAMAFSGSCGRKILAVGAHERRLNFPARDPEATDRTGSLSATGAQMDPEAQKERKHFN